MSDVVLTLSAAPDGPGHQVTAEVLRAEGPLRAVEAVPSFDRERLETQLLQPLRAFTEREVPLSLLRALGRELAGLLLPPGVRDLVLAEALRSREGVRLRLSLQEPGLASLPWEFLY